MNIRKKGQIEMIGLVIVVILLAIGLLFYVKFGVLREDKPKEDVAVENAYVTNLMGAIFNVKVCDTAPMKVEEGIIECFNHEQICGEEACGYLNNSIKGIIADIGLGKYRNYSIWVEKGTENRTITNNCRTGILAHTTIVTPDRAYYTANFRVC